MLEEVLELSRRVGDRGTVIDTLQTIGWISALYDGDADTALAMWSEALSSELDPADEVPLVSGRVVLSAWRGEPWDDDLARVDSLAGSLSEPSFRSMGLDARGWIALCEGRLGDAQRLWAERLASVTDPLLTAMSARIALWAGDEPEATRWADRLNGLSIHLPAAELRRRSVAAGLLALRGDLQEATASYGRVLADWRLLGHRYEVAFTAIDMATLLDPETDAVRQAADEARVILAGLGARAILERLETAMARAGRVTPTTKDPDRSATEARPAG
jgi:hypothetical protein